MAAYQTHFEVFARRSAGGFNMELLLHDRDAALAAAEEMFAGQEFIAVRVVREDLDPETGEFKSKTLLRKGPQDEPKTGRHDAAATATPCTSVADLYAAPARSQIARLLEPWLARALATPFELLHRPDLVEKLEASPIDLQQALQKGAIPQALARAVGVHEVLRSLQALSDKAIRRVLADARHGQFAPIEREEFAALCLRLTGVSERSYLLGGGVGGYLAPATSWNHKIDRLIELIDAAPADGPARDFAFQTLSQPLGEILATPAAMAELLGPNLDLGGRLAAMTQLVAPQTVEALVRVDPSLVTLLPPQSDTARRLAGRLGDPGLDGLRRGLERRVLEDLAGSRRLRPADPAGEIGLLRLLSLALTAAAGDAAEPVRAALTERGKQLVGAGFITAYLAASGSPIQEALELARVMETVTGDVNRRQALRWIDSSLAGFRPEPDPSAGAEAASSRLGQLARLHQRVLRAAQGITGSETLLEKVGELGDRIEAEAKLIRLIGRSPAPAVQKLDLLLKMATAQTAPPGPVAQRAWAEAQRLIRSSGADGALAGAPEAVAEVRAMIRALEAAA